MPKAVPCNSCTFPVHINTVVLHLLQERQIMFRIAWTTDKGSLLACCIVLLGSHDHCIVFRADMQHDTAFSELHAQQKDLCRRSKDQQGIQSPVQFSHWALQGGAQVSSQPLYNRSSALPFRLRRTGRSTRSKHAVLYFGHKSSQAYLTFTI